MNADNAIAQPPHSRKISGATHVPGLSKTPPFRVVLAWKYPPFSWKMGRFLGRNYPPIFRFREGKQILNIDNCPPLIEWGDSWGIHVYSVTIIGTHHTRSCPSLKMGRSGQKDTCPISKINVKMGRYWSKYHSLMSKREGFGIKHPPFCKKWEFPSCL